MHFFLSKKPLYSIDLDPLKVMTPLGEIALNCNFDKGLIKNSKPFKVETNDLYAIKAVWQSQDYYIEFLKFKFNPIVPSGMIVDDCICIAWRLKALKSLTPSFSCLLKTDLIGSPDSGQGLMAQTFMNQNVSLAIGTEDEEFLSSRALVEDWMPERLRDAINPCQIKCVTNGMKVNFPYLLTNERMQMHFIVAWSSQKDADSVTWFAAEQEIGKIIDQAGFSY